MDSTRIFSYADRSNLVDLASSFAGYMKQTYPQVKEVRNVTLDHVQAFMSAKCDTASQATLDQYASRFSKLERLVNDTYLFDVVKKVDGLKISTIFIVQHVTHASTVSQVLEIIKNLDSFIVTPFIYTYRDLGKYWLDNFLYSNNLNMWILRIVRSMFAEML